ncbi:MAG: efflux RND transporter permease subunit [Campylobacterota bacterium]|nr:efflux RND transporter permease subunit [Campylobacterota bacterium]
MIDKIFHDYLLKFPKIFFTLLAIFMAVMFTYTLKLEIDASAETLLLEGDKDLEFTRQIGKRFSAPDFLVVTYSVKNDLLSNANLEIINNLSNDIKTLDVVESITSITNVPLLQSPPKPLEELIENIPTLQTVNIDKTLAKKEFLNSPIYKENLVSDDFKTTSILVNLKRDNKYFDLINKRDKFIDIKKTKDLSKEELDKFQEASSELKQYRDILRVKTHNYITNIRAILKKYEEQNSGIKLHLGGANMVADDMVEFVKSDLSTFGVVILALLVITLYILFKEIKWIVIPLFICSFSIVITSGFLGLFSWEITVISSNFVSLQLIMNMSLIVHLIVKYKELNSKNPNFSQKKLVFHTVSSMIKPSFFVVVTTIAGFSSLVFSGILPIITFGWMMSIGIVVSLITTFILFPIVLIFLDKSIIPHYHIDKKPFTLHVANIAYNYKKTILFGTLVVVIFSITGAYKLRVENSFIDYFKQDTQIYQGMKLIDQKLGGTTLLDIVLTFKENSDEIQNIEINQDSVEDDFLDSFEDEFEETEQDKNQYWFTQAKMQRIKKVHNYMDSLEPIGKVLSLATITEVGKSLNDGQELDSLSLALLYKELPLEYKRILLTPYVDVENNMVRISTRVKDSMANLKRDELLKKIDKDLKTIINPKYEEYKISNLLVIYNNMLQSLFDSQIKTIGVVVFILFVMFFILFKSLKIALIAMVANTIPVGVIFGFMGWMDIPLDMMTITIAAISIGIAVDDTIHYIHRFKEELKISQNKKDAMFNTHKSIGTAMFYTSTIIMIGFSILVLSSFIPTIYFGLLTMLAMFMAIIADLLLLPILLLLLL